MLLLNHLFLVPWCSAPLSLVVHAWLYACTGCRISVTCIHELKFWLSVVVVVLVELWLFFFTIACVFSLLKLLTTLKVESRWYYIVLIEYSRSFFADNDASTVVYAISLWLLFSGRQQCKCSVYAIRLRAFYNWLSWPGSSRIDWSESTYDWSAFVSLVLPSITAVVVSKPVSN